MEEYNNGFDYSELYKELANFAGENIYVINEDTYELLYANKCALRGSKIKESPFGKPCYEVFQELNAPCEFCSLRYKKYDTIIEAYDPNFKKNYLVRYKRIKWKDINAIVICTDNYTKQVAERERISRDREKYRMVFDYMGVAYFEYDNITGDFFASEEFKKYEISKVNIDLILKNQAPIDMIHPNDVNLAYEFFAGVEEHKKKVEKSLRCKMTDGSYRWTVMTGYFDYDENNNTTHILGTFRDIHDDQIKYNKLSSKFSAATRALNAKVITYDITNDTLIQDRNDPVFSDMDIVIKNPIEKIIANHIIDERDAYKFRQFHDNVKTTKEDMLQIDIRTSIDYRDHIENKWLRLSYTIIRDVIGNPTKAWGVIQGIDNEKVTKERFEIEEASKFGEDKHLIESAIVNLSKNKVLRISARDNTEIVNDDMGIEDLFNFEKNNIDSLKTLETYKDKLTCKNLIKSYQKGEDVSLSGWRIDENGMQIYVHTIVKFLQQPDTKDLIAFIYTYNETNKRVTEIALRRTCNLNYDYIAGINIKNHTGFHVLKNESSSDIKKLEMNCMYKDFLKNRISKYVAKSYRQRARRLFDLSNIVKHIDKNGVYSFELEIINDNNEKRNKQYTCFRVDENEDLILLLRADVTALISSQKIQNEQLQSALDEAKKAAKSKGEFFSNLSHDMRTPLNGVTGFTSLALESNDIVEIKDYLLKIKQSSDFLLDLINDSLDLSKIEKNKIVLRHEMIKVKDLVNDTLVSVKVNAENKGINLHIDEKLTSNNTYINVDKLRLQQIFLNILSNAIKFTPSGGNVDVIFNHVDSNSKINCKISVCDNGIGISKEFLPSLFEAFEQDTTVNNGTEQGTGLGLTIAKQLVDIMGGHIEVSSQIDKGTTFDVYLPIKIVSSMDIANTKDLKSPDFSKDLSGKRVLLCEDNMLNTEISVNLLEKKGIIVEHALNGKEGVALFTSSTLNYYDAILMDINMPVLNGFNATKIIRGFSRIDARNIPIIAMTANAFDEDIQKSLDVGMNAHIAKPINPSILYEVLTKEIK